MSLTDRDAYRCRECEALVNPSEEDLCEDCHSDYIGWLMEQDMKRMVDDGVPIMEAFQRVTLAAYAPGHTPGSDASRLSQVSSFLPDTDDPEDIPF